MFVAKSARIFTISTAQQFRKETKEEKLFIELKPILQVSRFFGLAPFSLRNTKLTLSKIGLIYSALCFVLYIYLFTKRILIHMGEDWEVKLKNLYMTIVLSTASCIFADCLGCLLGIKKLQSYINYIRRFDISMKCRNESSVSFVRGFWKIFIGLLTFLLIISALTYKLEKNPLLGSLTYFMFCAVLMIGILKFLAFTIIIFIRFRQFNSKLIKDISFVVEAREKNKRLNWHEQWKNHKYLTEAAKKLNAKYSLQLLLWFSVLSLNCILQIYEYLKSHQEIVENIREILLALFFILLLTALAVICHFTANEANQMGRLLSSPEYCQQFNINDQQILFSIGQHFQFNNFNFSASGFFNINLPVLLTIASAITTYLVILK